MANCFDGHLKLDLYVDWATSYILVGRNVPAFVQYSRSTIILSLQIHKTPNPCTTCSKPIPPNPRNWFELQKWKFIRGPFLSCMSLIRYLRYCNMQSKRFRGWKKDRVRNAPIGSRTRSKTNKIEGQYQRSAWKTSRANPMHKQASVTILSICVKQSKILYPGPSVTGIFLWKSVPYALNDFLIDRYVRQRAQHLIHFILCDKHEVKIKSHH